MPLKMNISTNTRNLHVDLSDRRSAPWVKPGINFWKTQNFKTEIRICIIQVKT